MPELPEVETVRRGLDKWVSGRRIATVEVLHPRAIRRHPVRVAGFRRPNAIGMSISVDPVRQSSVPHP